MRNARRYVSRWSVVLLPGLLGLAGCEAPDASEGADPEPVPAPGAGIDAADAGPDTPASATVLPAGAPDRFGFGSAATPARIALWDIDVRPDGAGLPEGSGSVADGERVFGAVCAACHGATGIEGPNDRLVGTEPWEEWPVTRTVGNYWPYATTLYDYVRKAMPQNAPGSLSADETYGVIAYVLHLNGLLPADAVLDASSLPRVEMPARDRFVPDDRVGGAEIR